MSNHENEIQFESYLNDVKETVDTPSDDIRGKAISEGIGNLRSRIGKLDIQVNTNFEKEVKEVRPHYEGTELADVAIDVYRNNLQEEKPEKEKTEEGCVTTKASRENTKAMVRALARDRNPSGAGNTGKYSHPATAGGSGNTGSPGPSNIVIPPLSMEEYKEQIFKDFGLIEEEVEETYEAIQEEFVEEELDLVSELETNLLEMSDRSWVEVDRATRQLCLEHGVLVKDINKEFRSRHGMFPDKWIKEQVEVEQCGWIPLDEVARVNKIGEVYDVTFMFRGGTQRFKFFWPEVSRPSRDDMQKAVEKFYPKARLIAFYPCRDQSDNYMVMIPPMTENYEITSQDNWVEMSEGQQMVYDMICEEEGEPTSFPFIEEDGSITLFIEDHDTGEEKEVVIEANKSGDSSLHDWFNKSKSSDGTKGWVQLGGKYAGKPCAKQPGQTTKPKCGSSKMKRDLNKDEEERAFRRKNREDGNPDRKGKAKNVATEEFIYEGDEMKGMSQKSGDKRPTDKGAGMTAQGVAKYNRRTGGNLKTAVTTPPSKLKPGSKAANRRKSFCARSRGWTGERGKAARRRWNC